MLRGVKEGGVLITFSGIGGGLYGRDFSSVVAKRGSGFCALTVKAAMKQMDFYKKRALKVQTKRAQTSLRLIFFPY
jgi:hypothetical protein